MSKKTNGTNGHDKDAENKLLRFPTLAERDKMRKARQTEEKKPASPPFFNFKQIPLFTRYILSSFIAVHILLQFLSYPTLYNVFEVLGFRPGALTGVVHFTPLALLSPFTHLFIHGSWMHLLFNSITALVTCLFFERQYGPRATAFFFFVSGIAGALFYLLLFPFSLTPVIGASAALSGMFGAMMLILFQHPHLRGIAGKRLSKYGPWPLVIFWVLLMTCMGLMGGDTMAWQAHVGGFLAGILLQRLLQKGKLQFLFN